MTRRTGTSLVEVLVTVGILGIGLTSVIALFPMAAITMGQALKDDRTATCAATADGYIRNVHYRNVVEAYQRAGATAVTESYFFAMDGTDRSGNQLSGNYVGPQLTGPGSPSALTPLYTADPSYPVFLDPMGVVANPNGSIGYPVGNAGSFASGTSAIPRVSLAAMSGQPSKFALRLCSQMDGLTYDDNGVVQSGANMRELRYNWLWVLQRPTNSDRITTTCKVVVFDRRVYLYNPPGTEAVYSTTFTPGQTSVSISGTTADVRKGSWVMDGTIGKDSAGNPIRHANFYRVLSVTDNGSSYTLELNAPITRLDGQTTAYTGNLLIMPAVADVYERPVLSANVVGQSP